MYVISLLNKLGELLTGINRYCGDIAPIYFGKEKILITNSLTLR
jgi:hypothetical protein